MNNGTELEVEPQQWEYGEGFQRKCMALCLKDPIFFQKNLGTIHPSYFESQGLSTLSSLMISYFKKHNTVPSYEMMEAQVNEYSITYGGEKTDDLRASLLGWQNM